LHGAKPNDPFIQIAARARLRINGALGEVEKMNKSTRFGVAALGFVVFVSGVGAAEVGDEQGDTVGLTIRGESLPRLLETFGIQHGHTFVVDPRVGKNVPAPNVYASGLSLSRAVAVIAAAYGACAIQISAKVTKIADCAQEQ
jgi:hypothetical protein